MENNSNNNSINLEKESPKKCQNKLENVNENNIKVNYSEKNYKLFKRRNIELRRYKNNNTINEKSFDNNNNDSLKEENPSLQDNSKNFINYNQINKNDYFPDYFSTLNNMHSNFNVSINKLEDNNSNLLTLSPKIEISKKRTNTIYSIMNKIFFIDFQQKNGRFEKINDFELEQIKKGIDRHLNEGKFDIANYCKSFIEENVLPFIKKSKLNKEQFEALKYNIEQILECCGLPKNYYSEDIYQQKIKKFEMNRRKSIEAMRKFRKEFGLNEKDYKDEELIQNLEENKLDINKTFQKMFG